MCEEPLKFSNIDVDNTHLSLNIKDRFFLKSEQASFNKSAFSIYKPVRANDSSALRNQTNNFNCNYLKSNEQNAKHSFKSAAFNGHNSFIHGQSIEEYTQPSYTPVYTSQANSFQIIEHIKNRVLETFKSERGEKKQPPNESVLGQETKNDKKKSLESSSEKERILEDLNKHLQEVILYMRLLFVLKSIFQTFSHIF